MKLFRYPLITAILSSTTAFASPTEVTLTAYTDQASYSSSAYNFEKQSQDPGLTRNRFNILYQPSNRIATEMVVGDLGRIADLGKTRCSTLPGEHEVKGAYPGQGHGGYPFYEDRKLDPMFWLVYSKYWRVLQSSSSSEVTPLQGHCYLVHQVGLDGVTIGMFYVSALIPGKSLTIDETELFQSFNR